MSDREFWDGHAAGFDDEPDHGLTDPAIRSAWRALLLDHLPPAPADVIDLGCGTGTLSVLLAHEGHAVRGLDFANSMLDVARGKAAGLAVEFEQGDAAEPPYAAGSCDVVLSRHVLWAMPDPSAAIAAWKKLLRPGGRLVLVEGHWATGAGLTAADCEQIVRRHRDSVEVIPLDDPIYWGGPTNDERYLMVSTR